MAISASDYSPTNNVILNGLLGGSRWVETTNTPIVLTYSFPSNPAVYGANYPEAANAGFGQLNASMQAATRTALKFVSQFTNLQFQEVSPSTPSIMPSAYTSQKAGSAEPALAWAYYPSTEPNGGDSWYNNASGTDNVDGTMGSNDYATVLHELGHALGMKHPHEASGGFNAMPASRDFFDYTVMSYRSYQGAGLSTFENEKFGYNQTYMQDDIATLQSLYGANFSYNAGNTVYTFSPTTGEMFINGVSQGVPGANRVYATIWDGGGTDTYDLSNYTTNQTINLQPGGWSTFNTAQLAKLKADGSILASGNIANAMLYQDDTRSLIENVIAGSGNDRIIGNVADNTVDGGAGNDTFVIAALRSQVTISTQGNRTILTSSQGTDTLTNVETVEFSDGTTLALGGGTGNTLPAMVTTYPAAALTQFITGNNPTAAQMDLRTKAATDAYTYYKNTLKVLNPDIGPYESLGVSFSYLPEFQKYLTAPTATFVANAYQEIFLRAPNAAQQQAFVDQITYFTGIYQSAGISAAIAGQQARGAVIGQMIGYVMTDPTESAKPGQLIDDRAIAYVNSLPASPPVVGSATAVDDLLFA